MVTLQPPTTFSASVYLNSHTPRTFLAVRLYTCSVATMLTRLPACRFPSRSATTTCTVASLPACTSAFFMRSPTYTDAGCTVTALRPAMDWRFLSNTSASRVYAPTVPTPYPFFQGASLCVICSRPCLSSFASPRARIPPDWCPLV